LVKKILSSSLLKASGIYSITSVINSAIPFLLLPILTRYLTPADYGIVSMFGTLCSITSVFVGVNIHGAIQREYFNKENIDIKQYIGNCLIILVSTAIATLTILYTFKTTIEKFIGVPENLYWIAIVISFYSFAIASLTTIYQAQMDAFRYSLFHIGLTLINVSMSILLIVFFKMNYMGRIYAQLAAYLIIGNVALIILILKYSKIKVNFAYIKKALSFGLPLVPHALGGMLITMTGRVIVNTKLGIDQTGIYTVATQIGSIIGILATSFNYAYAPWLYDKLNKKDQSTNLRIVKLTYIYFIIIIISGLALGIISPVILKILVGREFQNAASIIIWMALGNSFNGMYYMVTNYIFYSYKTYLLTIITFIIGLLNIGLTYYLVSIHNLAGAAQSFMISNALSFLVTWIVSASVFKMPWNIRTVIISHKK
jgi:O-antigen/teichoic acid export membrane protein